MKKKNFVFFNISIILLILITLGFFCACTNLTEADSPAKGQENLSQTSLPSQPDSITNNTIVVTANLSSQEQSSARSAAPYSIINIDLANFDYAAALYVKGATFSDSMLIKGEYSSGSVSFIFPIPAENSNLVLEIFALEKNATLSTTNALLYDKIENLSITSNTLNVIGINLEPYTLSSKKGSVGLAVSLPEGCTLECNNTNFTCSSTAITATNIAAGYYKCTFTVKKGSNIIYLWTETITVYPGMATNTWNTGSVSASGKREITAENISSTFYVCGSNFTWYETAINAGLKIDKDNMQLGSLGNPFNDVQSAINKIVDINDGSTEYTIYIDGTVTATSGDTVVNLSAISKELKLNIKSISSDKATIDGGSARRVIGVGNNVTLKLDNLTITGGKSNGAGGGIRAEGSAKLYINNCTITFNEATTNNGSGGGIYANNTSGILRIEDSEISYNIAESYGGGLATSVLKGSGTETNAFVKNTNIIFNAANKNGGGVSITGGYLTLSGCTQLENNSVGAGCFGTGIYASANILLDGATNIRDEIYFTGAPIYVYSGFSLKSGSKINIDPTGFADGKVIIKGEGSHNLTSAQCNSFTISDSNYKIKYEDNVGKLKIEDNACMTPGKAIDAIKNAEQDSVLDIEVKVTDVQDLKDISAALTANNYKLGNGVTLVIDGGDDVNEIPDGLFRNVTTLTSVEIKPGITTIGEQAFSGCNGLTELEIPEGVTEIKTQAFSNCEGLKKITLPTTLEKIARQAFSCCRSLTEMIFKAPTNWYVDSSGYAFTTPVVVSDASIAAGYFKNDASPYIQYFWSRNVSASGGGMSVADAIAELTKASNENKTVEITVTLNNDSEVETLAETIDTVGDSNNVSVKLAIADDSEITKIPDDAFNRCINLISIALPDTITEIGESAFYNCGLTSLTISENITKIGWEAFANCDSLSSVEFEKPQTWYATTSENWIGGFCMEDLTNSSQNAIWLRDTYCLYSWYRTTELGKNAAESVLASATSGSTVSVCVELNDPSSLEAFIQKINDSPAGKVDLIMTGNTTEIDLMCFYNCTKLRSIALSKNVTKIKVNAFSGCTNLEEVFIPASVVSISNFVFSNCTNLKKVVFEDELNWYLGESEGDYSVDSVSVSTPTLNAYNFSNIAGDERWRKKFLNKKPN